MKFGLIKEGKTPADKRAVFSPETLLKCKEQFPQAEFYVQKSDVRAFHDDEYTENGFEVVENLADCDVILGVKEIPIDQLVPNKTHMFFSHTIKEQPYNKKLLQACLAKNIRLIDHETLVDANNDRLAGFGRYAGIVGAYNGLRAFGLKYELFNLRKAEFLKTTQDLIDQLKKQIFPPIKIVLTGKGKVAMGAREVLVGMKMKEVNIEQFLQKEFDEPVFVQIQTNDYYRRIDGKEGSHTDFKNNPSEYESDFLKFANMADVFIAGHYYKAGSPDILTQEMLKNPHNNIKVVADVSCDIAGPIACTIRPSTIAEPIYGYNPYTHTEVAHDHPAAITVMAVDNLPCELPYEATMGFGQMFLENIMPAFFNEDNDEILKRGTICENGKLTDKFSYLKNYAEN